jgi:hypothetical protein
MQFIVLSPLHVDGVRHEFGELVDMPESQAQELVKIGAVEPVTLSFSQSSKEGA